jgi:hypothetical protein
LICDILESYGITYNDLLEEAYHHQHYGRRFN